MTPYRDRTLDSIKREVAMKNEVVGWIKSDVKKVAGKVRDLVKEAGTKMAEMGHSKKK